MTVGDLLLFFLFSLVFANLARSFGAIQSAWQFAMPILEHWQRVRVRDLPEYQCGTWGPTEADRIIRPDGRQWRAL